MTREEWAIKIIKAECYVFNPLNFDKTRMVNTALDMAIRGLEAWEKVKAEIDQKQYDFMGNKDYDEGIRFGLMLAYQIIDKYKAESEVQNEDCD